MTGDRTPDLELRRSRPVIGSVDGLPSPEVSVRILTYKLPGVETEVLENGTFRLHHLPPETPVQLLVDGLPPGYTHRGVRVTAGSEDVAIHVTQSANLRGRALFADTDLPAAGAVVYHENGPSGRRVATADENGWFSLTDLPSGEVWIHASATSTEVSQVDGVLREVERSGRRSVEVDEGRDLNGVEIRIF